MNELNEQRIGQENVSDDNTSLAANLNHRRRKNKTKRDHESIDFSIKDFESIGMCNICYICSRF